MYRREIQVVGYCTFDTDIGYRLLAIGNGTLDIGYRMLDIEHLQSDKGHRRLDIGRLVSARRSWSEVEEGAVQDQHRSTGRNAETVDLHHHHQGLACLTARTGVQSVAPYNHAEDQQRFRVSHFLDDVTHGYGFNRGPPELQLNDVLQRVMVYPAMASQIPRWCIEQKIGP